VQAVARASSKRRQIHFTAVAGWNTQPVVTPVTLCQQGTIGLHISQSSNSLAFKERIGAGQQFKYANFTFGAMPQTFPAINGQGSSHWSLYGTLTP
jgi:hypothetical protein